mmetsp:Transcript_8673/g.15622  ORF Transcript_8673/g.15622 Transcript_8673/m.15622 type:complete len:371 (+) Transcript_8673:95-1207(+)
MAEEAQDTPSPAELTLSRESKSEKFGMRIALEASASGGHAVNEIIAGGVLDAHNKANPEKRISTGDVILSVNGKTGFDGMMTEFKESLSCALRLSFSAASRSTADASEGSKSWEDRRSRVTAALIPGLKAIVEKEFGAGASAKMHRVEAMYVRIGRGDTFEDEGEHGRRYAPGYISDLLPVKPFHNTEDYPWCAKLQQRWEDVRDELRRNLDEKHWSPGAYASSNEAYGKDWKIMGVLTKDKWQDEERFKVTTEVVKQLAGVSLFEVFFARMPPRTSIAPHSDNLNYILTSHLALELEEGACAIKVGNEERLWKEGEVMVLDTAFIHSTRNDSARERYVLVLRFWHPGLSELERRALHVSQTILASTGGA